MAKDTYVTIESRLASLEARFDALCADFNGSNKTHNARLDGAADFIRQHDARLSRLEALLVTHTADFKRTVNYLSERIDHIERDIHAIKHNGDPIDGPLSDEPWPLDAANPEPAPAWVRPRTDVVLIDRHLLEAVRASLDHLLGGRTKDL